MMSLKMAERMLRKVLNQNCGLDFEYSYEDGSLIGKNSLTLNGIDDDIFCKVRIRSDGAAIVRFTFDKIERTDKVLELINDYNENNLFLKVYADDEYLQVETAAYALDVKSVGDYVYRVFQQFAEDESIELLKPICAFTHD